MAGARNWRSAGGDELAQRWRSPIGVQLEEPRVVGAPHAAKKGAARDAAAFAALQVASAEQ